MKKFPMLDYQDLYKEIGNLFYAIAAVDGKINKNEKKMLASLVAYSWRQLEKSAGEYGTDAANIILFQFDINEKMNADVEEQFGSFASFFEENYNDITPYMREKILNSARSIAESTRKINHNELSFLMKLRYLVGHGYLKSGENPGKLVF